MGLSIILKRFMIHSGGIGRIRRRRPVRVVVSKRIRILIRMVLIRIAIPVRVLVHIMIRILIHVLVHV